MIINKAYRFRLYPNLKQKELINKTLGSTYQKYHNKKVIEKYEKRIKQKQRRLFKKEKGSNNYNKLKQEIARIYRKIKNARKYLFHHITKEITENNDIIACETLKKYYYIHYNKIV